MGWIVVTTVKTEPIGCCILSMDETVESLGGSGGVSILVEEIVESLGGGGFLFLNEVRVSLFSSLFSLRCLCDPKIGSFLIEACLITNFAMFCKRADLPRFTIS